MIKKVRKFIFNTLLGGVIVVLPIVLLAAVFAFVFRFVLQMISPLTNLITANSEIHDFIANLLAVCIIVAVCFIVGIAIRTRLGKYLFSVLENNVLKVAPGYTMIKETVLQLLGNKKLPFSAVVLVKPYPNSDVLMTGFIASETENFITVFIPFGPTPTQGLIYHLKPENVHKVDISTEVAMRSIISCGAGSEELIKAYKSKAK